MSWHQGISKSYQIIEAVLNIQVLLLFGIFFKMIDFENLVAVCQRAGIIKLVYSVFVASINSLPKTLHYSTYMYLLRSSPINLPYEAPHNKHGTNRPLGTLAPYVQQARK